MSMNLPMYVAGLGLVLLSMVGLLVLLRRRSAAPTPVEEPAAEVVEDEQTTSDVRTLRAQVRVLEEVLERVTAPPVEEPELAAYRLQVRSAIDAVASRTTADADPRLVARRVAAAVQRLDADPAARVVLPEPLRRPVVVEPVAAEPEPVAEETAPVGFEDEDEVVLPVPPPAPAETRRTRRRLRGSAA